MTAMRLCFALLVALSSSTAGAQLYKCASQVGVLYQDKPCEVNAPNAVIDQGKFERQRSKYPTSPNVASAPPASTESSGTPLWQGTAYGMSVDEVKALFPDVQTPSKGDSLH